MGGLLSAQGKLRNVWCVLALVLAAAAVLFVWYGQFTRKAHVSGYLVPTQGMVRIVSPQAGTVLERRAVDNRTVRQGDVLLVISSEHANALSPAPQAAAIDTLRSRRASLQREQDKLAQIDHLAQRAIGERLQGLKAELAEAQAQQQWQRERVAIAAQSLQRQADLVAAGFVADAALEAKRNDVLEARRQLAGLQRDITVLQRDIAAAPIEVAAGALKQANHSAAIDRQISEVDEQLSQTDSRRMVVLRAPVDGTVTTVLADVGQAVTPGTTLLSILPQGAQLQARLLVPTRAAGFLRPHQEVALRYPAFAYQRFGHHIGDVVEISRSVVRPQEANLPVAMDEPVYVVTVSLRQQAVRAYGREFPLQPDMTVDADVHLERRRLLDWVLDPVQSVTGRL
ncbi:hypothetical protein ASC87_00850 [Rhizobacter sp. Root1221]|nr:hypothetical protein ASC87_00850 [Rhizobacter sp. Root1221]